MHKSVSFIMMMHWQMQPIPNANQRSKKIHMKSPYLNTETNSNEHIKYILEIGKRNAILLFDIIIVSCDALFCDRSETYTHRQTYILQSLLISTMAFGKSIENNTTFCLRIFVCVCVARRKRNSSRKCNRE